MSSGRRFAVASWVGPLPPDRETVMVEMTGVRPGGTRSSVKLAWCAVVGLAALATAQFNEFVRALLPPAGGGDNRDVIVYSSLGGLVPALLVWYRWPRRSWVVLLVVGALFAAPTHVLLLVGPDGVADWVGTPYLVVDSVSEPLLLVGVLGLATVIWRAGRRGAGAALLGSTVVVLPLIAFIFQAIAIGIEAVVPVVALILLAATVLTTIAAAFPAGVAGGPSPAPLDPEPESRPWPGWQVAFAGIVAGVAPVVFHLWPAPDPHSWSGEYEAFDTEVSQYYLLVGLVVLGIGVVAGAVAGARVLVTSAAAGALIGAMFMTGQLRARDLFEELSIEIPAIVAVGALAIGVLVAATRARTVIGVAGLGVLIAGLLVSWANVGAEDRFLDSGALLDVFLLGLTVVAIAAAVSTFATLGAVLAATGEAPAAFAGVVTAIATGLGGIGASLSYGTPTDGSDAVSTYPPALALIAVAIALTVVAHRLWRDQPEPFADEPLAFAGRG